MIATIELAKDRLVGGPLGHDRRANAHIVAIGNRDDVFEDRKCNCK